MNLIDAKESYCICNDAFFLSLHANPYGGAVYCDSSETTLTVLYSNFIDDTATSRGGGIAANRIKLLHLSKNCFVKCGAQYGHSLSMNLELVDRSTQFKIDFMSEIGGSGVHGSAVGAHLESSINNFNSSYYQGQTGTFIIHFSSEPIVCRNFILAESNCDASLYPNTNKESVSFYSACVVRACTSTLFVQIDQVKDVFVSNSIFIFPSSLSSAGENALGSITGFIFEDCVSNIDLGSQKGFISYNPAVTSINANIRICAIRDDKETVNKATTVQILSIFLLPLTQ